MLRFGFKAAVGLVVILALTLGVARGAAWLREGATLEQALPEGVDRTPTSEGVIASQAWGDPANPPVLLVHGTGAWSELWAETGQALAQEGYYAVALDVPPFGFSDRDPAGAYDRATQARRLVAFSQTMPRPPVLVAHSFGAAPGAEALLTAPQAFAGAVIVNGAIGLGKDPQAGGLPAPLRPTWLREMVVSATATNPLATRVLLQQLIHQKEAATDARVDILQRPMTLRDSTPDMAAWLVAFMAPEGAVRSIDPTAYAALDLPVQVIWGAEDTVTPVDQAHGLAAALAQDPAVVLPNVGHIPQIEAPAAFQEALIAALGKVLRP